MNIRAKPNYIFKYCTIESGLNSLISNTLLFSNPKNYNDPFDGQIPIDKFVIHLDKTINSQKLVDLAQKKVLPKSSPERNWCNWLSLRNITVVNKGNILDVVNLYNNDLNELAISSDNILVYCATDGYNEETGKCDDTPQNELLWSHYAGQHTGIVIKYEPCKEEREQLIQVNYVKNFPEPFNSLQRSDKGIFYQSIVEKYRTKSEIWKYESEWRLVGKFNPPNGDKIEETRIMKSFKGEIDSVYLGYRMSGEDKKLAISALCKIKNIYPNIKLYETGLRDDYFGFIFNEIPIDEANLYPQDNPSENTTH